MAQNTGAGPGGEMHHEELVGAIRDATACGDSAALRLVIDDEHPADIAAALEEFEPHHVWAILDLLPALAQAEWEDIRRLAGYEEDTAGSIMTSDSALLNETLSAAQAIEKLRHEAPDKETIYRAYVTDPERRLVGAVRLQDLILAAPRTLVRDLMEEDPVSVTVDEDQEEVARKISRYDVLALPVVDAEHRIVGIVTHDDAMDVIQEEATEDFHKVGTVGKLDRSVRDASGVFIYFAVATAVLFPA